jgi:hypothetical protein
VAIGATPSQTIFALMATNYVERFKFQVKEQQIRFKINQIGIIKSVFGPEPLNSGRLSSGQIARRLNDSNRHGTKNLNQNK